MIPPDLDVTSELFDANKALHSNKVRLPYPKVKTYNNIAEYYSHTFLKKGLESLKSSKSTEKPRERNYEWYYDTLGLSEYERNFIQCTKKKKYRKGKKPVSVATIPGSPLKSEKVTVCKSDFKEYCQRKYRSLNTSAIIDTKSVEFQTFPTISVSESSSLSQVIKTEPLDSTSALQFIKLESSEFAPTSFYSTETNCPFSLNHTVKSELPELSTASHIIKAELPTISCVVKNELSDSSNDSFTDDVLIFKMKSNLQKVYRWKNVYESPVSFQIKNERLELSSKNKHMLVDSKYVHDPHQATNDKKLSKIYKPGSTLNSSSNMKSSIAVDDSESTPSSQVNDSSESVTKQKKGSKKHKICSNNVLKSQKDHKTPKHKKKQTCEKNKDGNSNVLDGGQPQKSTIQNIPSQKKCGLYKENSSINDSKSNILPIKKRGKSALKSQENVLDRKKLSTAIEVDSKPNIVSKIKTESSPVINHCTCKFPCGLSHLCTCGYFASAKEVLSKFKIPRKKK